MEKLYKLFGDRIVFVGINVGINERVERVREYARRNNTTFTIIFDRGSDLTGSAGVVSTPTHILIDKDGIVRHRGARVDDMEGHMKGVLGQG